MRHVFRCLNLALSLREHLGLQPHFLMLAHSVKSGFNDFLEKQNVPVSVVSGEDKYLERVCDTQEILRSHRRALIFTDLLLPDPTDLDLLDDCQLRFTSVSNYIVALRQLGIPVFSITDDTEKIDIRPNVVVAASCHHPATHCDEIDGTRFLLGPNYYLLGTDFAPYLERVKMVPGEGRRILLVFGGSDHDLFSLKVTRALCRNNSLLLSVVLGPAVPNAQKVARELRKMGAEVFEAIPSVARFMFEADIVITTGGNTTFELASVGTPAITLCTRQRQMRNANYFQTKGTLVNLGLGQQVSDAEIRNAVEVLASDKNRRMGMSRAGRQTVDGHGLRRVRETVREYFVQSGATSR